MQVIDFLAERGPKTNEDRRAQVVKELKMAKINRRSFLGATIGSVLGASGLFAGEAFAKPIPVPKHWDRTVDVLVVGSGFSGLSAAIEARTNGADVLCIEKMAMIGGNSVLSAGGLAAPGNDLQVAAGIKDSPELLLKDMLKSGGNLNNVECAKVVAYGALAAYRWAKDFLGVKFDRLGYQGGHSVARSACYMNGNGANMIGPMSKKCKEIGVPVETRSRLLNLVLDEKGAVIGAEVQQGYVFPKEDSGKKVFIRTKKGVVVCGGGFSQNVKLRMLHDPRLGPQLDSTNQPGATGDAMQAAQRVGAADVQMDWIQLGPWTSPDEPGFGVCPKFVESSVGYGLMVDPKTGKRFVNETGNRKVRSDAILLTGHPAILLVSEANSKHVPPSTIEAGLKNGAIKKFANLEALAKEYGINATELKSSVSRWNEAIASKNDPDFAAKIFDDTVPNEGSFYACRLWPRVHYCMGGLAINTKAEVLSTDLDVIPGLYAAGEVTGGVHGMVRLGTVSIADCLVFGRVAGRNAAMRKA